MNCAAEVIMSFVMGFFESDLALTRGSAICLREANGDLFELFLRGGGGIRCVGGNGGFCDG